MNIPHKQLSVDINRRNQYTVDFIGHVNDKDVRYIDVTFNAGGTPITLEEGCTATVTYVSEGVLIDQAADCTVSGSTVVIGVDSEKVENLRSGILEVQPKVVDPNGRILTMQIPILVRISPDIAEHGQVDDDSLGSYAEVVREIAAARGDYPDLKDRLDHTGAPTDEQVATAVSEWLDDHPEATTTVEDGAVTAAKIGSGAVTAAKLGSDVNTILDGKVIKPSTSPNGTNGQILRTKGDGTTEWVDVGLPTDAQTAAAVSDWLDDHPEATTTVEDGSVTLAKLHSGVIDSTLSTQGAAEAEATGNEIKADAALVAGESLITTSLLEPYNATFTNVEYTTTANKTLMADGTIIDYNSGKVSNVVTLTPDTLYECNCGGIGGGGAHFFLYDSKKSYQVSTCLALILLSLFNTKNHLSILSNKTFLAVSPK